MKKILGVSISLLGAVFAAQASSDNGCSSKGITSDVSGHTFFTVRRPFIAPLPEVVSGPWRGAALRRDCGMGGAIQVVPFGGQSTNRKDLARYFMFNNKDTLVVSNEDQNNGSVPDVNPTHFNILATTYTSTIRFSPRQTFGGVGIAYRQYLGYNDCCERTWFVDINTAVVRVSNDVKLTETIQTAIGVDTDGAQNMIQGFAGTTGFIGSLNDGVKLEYGKIDGRQRKTRLQDIELKLGYQYVCNEEAHCLGYVGLDIPAGNKPNAEYLFEAIVGNNQHVAIMTGIEAGFELWRDCDRSLWWEIDGNTRYFISNTQRRLIPLRNRVWSQYMLLYANQDDATNGVITPGANILAQKVKVHPRYEMSMNSAMVYASCGFQAEVGYNYWSRQEEKLQLKNEWPTGTNAPYVAGLTNTSIVEPDFTDRLSNIGDNNTGIAYDGVTNFGGHVPAEVVNALTVCDLDLNKAAHPAALSHVVYGSLGYCFDNCYPTFVALGGSYEFSGVNTALSRWTIWGKLGVSI
jgi:hypothetical protein